MIKKRGPRKGDYGVRRVASWWVKEGKEVKEGNSLLVVEVSGSTQSCGWGRAFCQLQSNDDGSDSGRKTIG